MQHTLLQNQLKEAIDRGDSESQVTLQKQMAELASQEARIKQVKQQQELQKQNPLTMFTKLLGLKQCKSLHKSHQISSNIVNLVQCF